MAGKTDVSWVVARVGYWAAQWVALTDCQTVDMSDANSVYMMDCCWAESTEHWT